MTLLDLLDPESLRFGVVGILSFVVFHAALGAFSVWAATRLLGRHKFRRTVSLALVVVAPLCGLFLVNVTYGCPTCAPDPEWCVAYSAGLPFRIGSGQHEPPIPPFTDACGPLGVAILFDHFALAAAGDYFLGLFGVPVVASLVGRLRATSGPE